MIGQSVLCERSLVFGVPKRRNHFAYNEAKSFLFIFHLTFKIFACEMIRRTALVLRFWNAMMSNSELSYLLQIYDKFIKFIYQLFERKKFKNQTKGVCCIANLKNFREIPLFAIFIIQLTVYSYTDDVFMFFIFTRRVEIKQS